MPDAIGRISEIVVDCRDPAGLAAFWGALLGASPSRRDAGWATVREPGTGLVLAFQRVPEAKVAKNRLHVDVEVADLERATTECVHLGAMAVGAIVRDEDGSFQVMVDPEGHEFCLVT